MGLFLATRPAIAAERYRALEPLRRPFLERARAAAALTIPSLAPPEGASGRHLPTPYQGVGARGVNTLANKLLLAQFPPDAPFFRLVDPGLDPADVEGRARLGRLARALATELEAGLHRAALHACLKQLIVAGNALLHAPLEGGLRVLRLDRYVVLRDPSGRVREIVVRERVAADLVPHVRASGPTVEVFTHIRREARRWSVRQEAEGRVLPESEGAYPLEAPEWLALRWSHVDGEDYGRGHVEEYAGDLKSLEGLMRAIVEGAAIAAKTTVLVSPTGQTDADALAEAENGAILDGHASDVTILQAGKGADFRVALETAAILSDRLAFAFLSQAGARRDAERVTAEEIRAVAAELEGALGGVYAVLAEELQLPLARLLLRRRRARGLPEDRDLARLAPAIVTGLDALGRGRERERLERFLDLAARAGRLAETPSLGAALDPRALTIRVLEAAGLEPSELLAPPPALPSA